MSTFKYNLVSMNDQSNLTLFVDGEMYTADNTHPNWDAIVAGLARADASIVDLFSVVETVEEQFAEVTDRVTVDAGRVYFDGEEIDNSVTTAIVRALREGKDMLPLARFLERISENPSRRSRENLYSWLSAHDFTINSDGMLVGYKGVNKNSDGEFVSVSSGTAYVDGEKKTGQIPNKVGSVVTMPRSEVMDDPAVACSHGLHAGTWGYASTFGNAGTLKVLIDPADVVSVPSDSGNQKLRCCRYTVAEIIEAPVNSVYDDEDEYDDYGDDEEWEDDGDTLVPSHEVSFARRWNLFK